jgi:tetratricopeptide (TPR) repeat protein/predicted Ser/Thr protein kinase
MARKEGSTDGNPAPSASDVTDSWVSADGQSELASVGASIARMKISQELFGRGGKTFGRFVLQQPLGSGGMGVVYEAHDPELKRNVALKLVRVTAAGAEEALKEARALAQLAHPNVVPVYDVGIDGDFVYLVMELVRGDTLKAWARGRKPREIVKAYIQAGEALAAAHDKGIVHRDFKPSNAIMGADGRVRVVDFGLAFQVADEAGEASGPVHAAGTPRYMAPEQAARAVVTAAADQYSFCVSLAEAFGVDEEASRTALPRWLGRVVAKGMAPDSGARYPAMRALLKDLANDPVTVWRRRGLALGLAVVGTAAFVGGRATLAAKDPACTGVAERLAAAWGDVDRRAALTRLGGLDSYGRSLVPFLSSHLDEHARRWIDGYGDACVAHRREIQSDQVFDKRVSCLERSRSGLKAFAEIVRSTDVKGLPSVALAMQAIPDPDVCADLNALDSDVEPPPSAIAQEVSRLSNIIGEARVQVAAGHFEEARSAAERTAAQARSLGYRPLLAEALLVQGNAARSIERVETVLQAVPLLAEAAKISFETGPRSLAVEAWARRAWVEGTSTGQASALAGVEVVDAVAAGPSAGNFSRALLHNNVGGVELALEHRDRARAQFERALNESQSVKGPGAVELVNVRLNLAVTTDDPIQRDMLMVDAENKMAALLGEDHPEVLRTRWIRAAMTTSFRAAIGLLQPVCPRLQASEHGAEECWSLLGFLLGELGQAAKASSAFGNANVASAGRVKMSPEASGYAALWDGAPKEALARFQAEISKLERSDESWWGRVARASLTLGVGRAQRACGHYKEAREALSQALALFSDVAEKHPGAQLDRLLGRTQVELAKALAASGGDSKEISTLARAGSAWLEKAGGDPDEIRSLARLVAREAE